MPTVHLVIGPVGSGKSTFVARLCHEHRAAPSNLDDWMATLFRPDRPETGVMAWYVERTERCVDQIWKQARGVLEAGADVVLELGLIQRGPRLAFLERVEAEDHPLVIYVVDAPREVRRERVAARNREQGATFSMVVPPEVFELASDLWEPPDADECSGRDVRFL